MDLLHSKKATCKPLQCPSFRHSLGFLPSCDTTETIIMHMIHTAYISYAVPSIFNCTLVIRNVHWLTSRTVIIKKLQHNKQLILLWGAWEVWQAYGYTYSWCYLHYTVMLKETGFEIFSHSRAGAAIFLFILVIFGHSVELSSEQV